MKLIKVIFAEEYAYVEVYHSAEEKCIIFKYFGYDTIGDIILDREEKISIG